MNKKDFSGQRQIKAQMREMGFSPKKFLGQHFLINDFVIQKIVSTVKTLNPSLIVEVGPGLGALTDELIQLNPPICVVERDILLCRYWRQKKVSVLEGDILKLPWEMQLQSGSVLVGNLPYQVASRLLLKCCPGPNLLKAMVLMFQKEVAQRILSVPSSKSYGILTVISQSFWEVEELLTASVSDFYPRPKVSGRVLVFRKKKSSQKRTSAFFLFVKFCFSQRRKFLLSRLSQWDFSNVQHLQRLPLPKDFQVLEGVNPLKEKSSSEFSSNLFEKESEKWTENCSQEGIRDVKKRKKLLLNIFREMSLSPSLRAEELSPAQFIVLFNMLEKKDYLFP